MNRRNLSASGLLDALQVGVLLTDSRGPPMRANAAAQRPLGCQADGSSASEQVVALAREAQRTGTAYQQELGLGQAVVQIRAVPIEDGALLELDDGSLARRAQHATQRPRPSWGRCTWEQIRGLAPSYNRHARRKTGEGGAGAHRSHPLLRKGLAS